MMRRFALAPFVLGCGLVPAAAHAQVSPPIEESITRGIQIEEAVEDSTRAQGQTADDQAIDGEAGIYILRKEEIFYVAGGVGVGYSTNPLRNIDDAGASGSADATLSLGMRTRMFEAFDFGIAANVDQTRYFEEFAPSSSAATGTVSLGLPIGNTPLYAAVVGFGGWNFDENFDNPVNFYGATAQLSATIPLSQNVVLQPGFSATRLWTEIEENNNKTVSGRLAITYLAGSLSVTAHGSAARVWFDDFYEDVTFIDREDWQYQAGLTASYRVSANFLITASATYSKRDSAFFLAGYESFDGGLSLSAVLRF